MKPSTIRVLGSAVALGAITWGAAWLFSPSTPETNSQVEIWASVPFQLGLLALLATMWATAATGTGRWGRGAIAAEATAVVLAIGWTIPHMFDTNRPKTVVLAVLDVFWPLSMAGLIVVGIFVARARRWPPPTCYLPLLASLVIPVDLAMVWAPNGVRTVLTAVYLPLTYGLLGLVLVRDAATLSRLTPTGTLTVQTVAR
jgi:hypothetical protein